MIELLLENSPSVNAQDQQHGLTPLMIAVRSGMVEDCKVLLVRGADVHLDCKALTGL